MADSGNFNIRSIFAVLPVALRGFSAIGQGISTDERIILDNVEKNMAKAMDFFKETVNINGGTFGPDGPFQDWYQYDSIARGPRMLLI